MLINMLKCKIHRATVKEAKLHYVGSITVDTLLMEAAGLLSYEKVLVVDLENGNRFETYVIPGERASGMVCVNGAAAHLVKRGNRVIVMAFCSLTTAEAKNFQPTVVFVDDQNHVASITNYEKHGEVRCE